MTPQYDPVAAILASERARRFQVLRPGGAPWFRPEDWKPASIASINGIYARLVLLDAQAPGKGAFTRTVAEIRKAHLLPCVVEPLGLLETLLARRGWHQRNFQTSSGDRETVWMPP